jgi:Flp pilus assembly protein TadG
MNMKTKQGPRSEPAGKTLNSVHDSRRILRSQSGQSLVELALLTPLLLLLIIGTVEMGRYAILSILVGNAARAGAAYGARNTTTAGDQTGIQNAALADLQDISSFTTQPTVTSTFVCGCDNGGTIIPSPETNAACGVTCNVGSHLVTSVQVTVTGTFNSMFNYPGIPSPLTLSSTATERVAE